MQDGSGDRAVAVQVGAIILFAFVIIAIAGYQASVVPNQNKQIEFDHNQEIQGQLQELEGTIGSMPATRERRTVTVDLGTSYPARTIFVNPPRPTGRLETVGTRNGSVNFTVENANATNPDIDDFWNGSTRNYSTGAVTYRPNYNVYGQAPVTVLGNSLVYNEFDTAIIKNQQSIFDGDTISLVALRGSLQENSGTASVSVRPVSASTTTVPVEADGSDNVTISIVSRLSPSRWNETITESEELVNQSEGGHVINVTGSSVGTVDGQPVYRVEFLLEDGVTYDLQLARVGVGDLSADESETNASYAVAVTDSVTTEEDTNATVTVEVRDQYDNPKAGVTVNASVGSGSASGSIADSPQTTNDDGRVTFTYDTTRDVSGSTSNADTVQVSFSGDPATGTFDESAPEDVTAEVTVKNTDGNGLGGGGGGGGGGAYGIEFDKAPDYTWDASADGISLALTAGTTPEAIEGASTDFAVNNSTVASISTEDGQTDASGEAEVTLEAQNNGSVAVYVGSTGASDVINVTVTDVPPGPTAGFTVTPSNPDSGESVSFDASSSSGNGRTITGYDWAFGDGSTATGETTSHSYGDDKSYTVTLTVTDSDGNTDTASKTVDVQNRGPSASFTFSPSDPTPGQTVSFDASTSSDPDDSSLSYTWDFGDGSSTGAGVAPSHSYSSTGTYTVTLTVEDDDGATATATKTVTVSDPALITAVGPDPNDGRGDDTEFVRVNFPSNPDTTGWTIVDGQDDTIDVNSDYSGEVYFVRDKQAFLERWSVAESRVVEYGLGKSFLRNTGEALELRDASDATVDEFAYQDPGANNGRTTSNNWHVDLGPGDVGERTKTSGNYDDNDEKADWTVLVESTFFNTRDTNTPQSGVAYVDREQTDSYSEYAVRTVDSQGRVLLFPDESNNQPRALGPARTDIDGDGYSEVVYVDGNGNLVVTDRRGERQVVPVTSDVKEKSVAVNGDTIYYVSNNNNELQYVTNTSSGWSSSTTITYQKSSGNSGNTNTRDVKAKSIGGIGNLDDDATLEIAYISNSGKMAIVEIDNGDKKKFNGISIGSNKGWGVGQPADFDGDGLARIPIVTDDNKVKLLNAKDGTTAELTGGIAEKAHLTTYDVDDDSTEEIVFANTSGYLKSVEYDTGTVSPVTDQNGNPIRVLTSNGEGVASIAPRSNLAPNPARFDDSRTIHRHAQIAAASSTRYA